MSRVKDSAPDYAGHSGAHKLNLPWTLVGRTLHDCTGVPVAVLLDYTTFRRREENGAVYNTSAYAAHIRGDFILAAIAKAEERQP